MPGREIMNETQSPAAKGEPGVLLQYPLVAQ